MLRTRTMFFDALDFPEDKLGLDMIDVMLITDFRIRDLSEEQSQVLIEWVRSGGVMILGTGARADDTLGRFAPELLEEMYEEPQLCRIDMRGHYTQEAPGPTVFEIPCVEFSLSGGNIILEDEFRTLLAAVTYRRGSWLWLPTILWMWEPFVRRIPLILTNSLQECWGKRGSRL